MEIPGLSFTKQADSFLEALKGQLGGIVMLVGAIWAVYVTDYIPFVNWFDWLAMRPRHITGLHGILTMPFVHGGFWHMVSNTIPLIIMLITLAALRPKTWPYVVGLLILASGTLTWFVGGSDQSIRGASGLVLALVTFLVAPGGFILAWWGYHWFRKTPKSYPFKIRLIPLVVSGLVGFFCFDNLFFDLVPITAVPGNAVSWRAHWCGAIAGLIVAFFFVRSGQVDALPEELAAAGLTTGSAVASESS